MNLQVEMISLRATEQLVDTLNDVVELDGDSVARLQLLLERLKVMLHRQSRCVLWLLDDLGRVPAPRIYTRVVSRGPHDAPSDGGLEMAQAAFDEATPMIQPMIRQILSSIRTPLTLVASQTDGEWFRSVLQLKYLNPLGYVDCIASMWASSADRAICLLCHRGASEPEFVERDCTMMTLVLRAAAPIIDREMFQPEQFEQFADLSERERQILLLLLAGDSEKEIARALHRSAHTVHTFVQKLYKIFEVSSRGELMAKFVDQAVVERIRRTQIT